MRSNLFLHFLNRDSREIYGLFKSQPETSHRAALLRATNAAVLLCEDYCVIPAGFAVECEIASSVLEQQSAFLRERLIRMPMREPSLTEFAEKKRLEYASMRERYIGLFDQRRMDFLSDNAAGIVPRKSKVGKAIARQWLAGPDTRSRIWKQVKEKLSGTTLEAVRLIPEQLLDSDTATTWAAIEKLLPRDAAVAADRLRHSLQHIYFKTYMDEFKLLVLRGAPLMHYDFMLRSEDAVYSYERFRRFLRVFNLDNLLLNGPAEFLVALKGHHGTIRFLDAYANLARLAKDSDATVEFASGRAANMVSFDWRKFAERHEGRRDWSDLEIVELADALNDAAQFLESELSLPRRFPTVPGTISVRKTFAKTSDALRAVLYEALDWIASEFARSPKERYEKNEDSLSDDVVGMLKAFSFNASRETKSGGHCDVVVDERRGFLWLGEAKIDKSNSWLFDGFQQLGTRYSTGLPGQDHAGMLIYCKKANAKATMDAWCEFVRTKVTGLTTVEDASNPLVFCSTHQHQGSGLPFTVRHLPFLIHWDPA